MIEKRSPCKVNLLLNILRKREDGFHELETVMQPVALNDRLTFEENGTDVVLTCDREDLPTDGDNLIVRAAHGFRELAGITSGVRVHLEKRIPVAAGLGGGSGNAAVALLGMNELFGDVLNPAQLVEIASGLGSDVPFFLQSKPALAVGRGEVVTSLESFPALAGCAMLLIRPDFGVSTGWAYTNLARFPDALNGQPGRAQRLIEALGQTDLTVAAEHFYNSLEFPVFEKYPWLVLLKEFLLEEGAPVAMMSGSGSTTFAIMPNLELARQMETKVRERFGDVWTSATPLD